MYSLILCIHRPTPYHPTTGQEPERLSLSGFKFQIHSTPTGKPVSNNSSIDGAETVKVSSQFKFWSQSIGPWIRHRFSSMFQENSSFIRKSAIFLKADPRWPNSTAMIKIVVHRRSSSLRMLFNNAFLVAQVRINLSEFHFSLVPVVSPVPRRRWARMRILLAFSASLLSSLGFSPFDSQSWDVYLAESIFKL
jgi:hypothetical protein